MRIKAAFTVFARKLPSGQRVFYYQCYDQKGNRQWAKSTGLSRKTEAVAFCMKLFKDGVLIPEKKSPTFAEFSTGWWDLETCRYLKWRQLHDPLTLTTIRLHKLRFHSHIKYYFDKYPLDEITPDVIESWLLHLSDKIISCGNGNVNDNEKPEGKKMKPQTINLVFRTFKLMMNEAVRTKILKDNPCRDVKELKEEELKRDILTVEEVRRLFPYNWSKVWENELFYKANRLAACTGMRIGELQGLRGEYVFDDYIYVCGQYTRNGYVPCTKTKENRNIPITPIMREELEELLRKNGNGFVFSDDGGNMPVKDERLRRSFDRALECIGINRAEKKERNLTFHSWRHFLNTLLRMSDVADSKVQSVTGHRSMKMTDHYTHFDTRKFAEVREVQTELLTFNSSEKNITNKKTTEKQDKKSTKTKTTKAKVIKTAVKGKSLNKSLKNKPVKKTQTKNLAINKKKRA